MKQGGTWKWRIRIETLSPAFCGGLIEAKSIPSAPRAALMTFPRVLRGPH